MRKTYIKYKDFKKNNKYGKLFILDIYSKKNNLGDKKKFFRAKCDCGSIVETFCYNIVYSPEPMCKTCLSLKKRVCKYGDKFDKLTVIDYQKRDGCNEKFALCQCECGNKKLIRASSLKKIYKN